MYLDMIVDIPNEPNKITYRCKSNVDYVYYEYSRIYDKKTKLTNPKRETIGKRLKENPLKMQPNQNYLKYFPEAKLPGKMDRTYRSSCLRIGDYVVIRKILEEYRLPDILSHYIHEKKNLGLFLDLVSYAIVTENNAGQYYPNYAYNHPLFTEKMSIYSDTKVSSLLHSITEDQSVGCEAANCQRG